MKRDKHTHAWKVVKRMTGPGPFGSAQVTFKWKCMTCKKTENSINKPEPGNCREMIIQEIMDL